MNETELPKTYSSQDVESKWYPKWEKEGYFKPKAGKAGKGYTIIMPPPNVTGRLHAGHALDITTQDTLIRFKRMKGFEALFLPGMDHAGIATQNIVEKLVWKEEKKTRHDFTREDFIKKIWDWKEEYGGIIAKQQRSMGASADWDYSTFTMDKIPHKAVNKVFVDLYNEGLIYQSDYIINWDPVLQSAISDAEVEHQEVKGTFYHLLYEVKETGQKIEIATTRPETLLGDTAVCVHPEDDRFKDLIGKTAIVPLCNREIPIIGDDYVDMEKGTGCLKVTPGHDFNDFEIGKRHNLPIINIINKDGTLNEHGLEWKDQTCAKARKSIVEKLEELEILIEKKPHVHQVGHGDRSKAIIEPMVSKQWFLNVEEMAKDACRAVDEGETTFVPKGWENTYFAWMREPKNWCLSRQLWWGHQIPVYYCGACDHQWASENDNEDTCPKCNKNEVTRDPDVLDTWFSSGLWPLSTLGWPDAQAMKEKKFDTFYPTATLITGFDIIFFWVARMMMMCQKATGSAPFEKVYIHAIVRDKSGRKMSKSLGNGIDPLEMVEQYGADAFRFTLAAGSGYNRNINLDPERIGGYRNFVNKIWNAFRFISPTLEKAQAALPPKDELDAAERWILAELNTTTKIMNESIEDFRFDESCSAIYSFVYDKFCSWFIELSKPVLSSENEVDIQRRATVLKYTFKKVVALLHPFTPYITEELWGHLKEESDDLLIVQEYPEENSELVFTKEQEDMNRFVETVSLIRNLRSSVNIKPKEEINVTLRTDIPDALQYYKDNEVGFQSLARVKNLSVVTKEGEAPAKSLMGALTHTEVFIPLEGVIDLNEQLGRLNKDLAKAEKELMKYEKKLGNEKFLANAKDDVVAEVKSNFEQFSEKVASLKDSIAKLS